MRPVLLLEAVLHLRAGIFLERAVPGDGDEPVRAGDGARLGGAEQEIVAEDVRLVGDDHHLVVGRALRQHRHLRLDLLMAGVGAALTRLESVGALLDDLGAEAIGRAADGGGISLVGRRFADDQHPVAPFLPQQVLGERVGAHRPVGRDMENVAAALLLPQDVVAGAHVEDERVLALRADRRRREDRRPRGRRR